MTVSNLIIISEFLLTFPMARLTKLLSNYANDLYKRRKCIYTNITKRCYFQVWTIFKVIMLVNIHVSSFSSYNYRVYFHRLIKQLRD